jgi:hypothetical protein
MSRALILLTWLRTVASWRAFWRSGRGSPVAFLGRLLIVAFMLAPAIGWVSAVRRSLASDPNDPLTAWLGSLVREAARLAPLPVLLFLILIGIPSALTKPLRFSATEVDLLFAGPFRRHQLVNFKLGAAFSGHVFLSFLVAAPLGTAVSGVLPVFVGSLLIFNFLHLYSLVVGLVGTTLGFHDSRGPRRLSFAFALLFGMLAILWFRFGKIVDDPIAVYRQLEHSLAWRIATSPLHWFVEVSLAKWIWPDLVKWSSLCLLVNGLLFVTVHKLDARLEARAEKNDERAADIDIGRPESERVPWTLPLLSRCQGMGPIAWRQCMNVVRRPELIATTLSIYGIVVFLLLALSVGSMSILFLPTLDGHVEINPAGAWACGAIAIALPMFLAWGLSFDFRGDMGQIDVFKALPIEPIVLAAGQLFVPVVIAAILQWLVMVAMAIAVRSVPAGLWAAAAFGPPVSVIVVANENLLTLWFPLRPKPGTTPEPFEQIGHALVHPILRIAGTGAAVVATSVVSAGAYFLFGQSVIAALAAAWLTLAAGGAGLVVLVSYVFDRFDVTRAVSA